MNDKQINEGVTQVNKAIRSMELSGRQMNLHTKEEEELALRQLISGIISEWQEENEKEKKGMITIMKLWTGKMMNNWARIQMKMWTGRKNEHKANVQRRGVDRCIMSKVFERWKFNTGFENNDDKGGREEVRGQRKEKRGHME
eukprot:1126812-Pleurochrysis_carterae.AAC.1